MKLLTTDTRNNYLLCFHFQNEISENIGSNTSFGVFRYPGKDVTPKQVPYAYLPEASLIKGLPDQWPPYLTFTPKLI